MRVILTATYQVEVQRRGRAYVDDPQVQENINAVARALVADDYKFGLMLCGTSGNGKTTMMNAIKAAVAVANHSNLFDRSLRLEVVDAVELARLFTRNEDTFRQYRKAQLLGIEDMGREENSVMSYGNSYNPMIELLEARYAEMLYTVITTNLNADEVRKKYGPRIADRFNEMLRVVVFKGQTYRR